MTEQKKPDTSSENKAKPAVKKGGTPLDDIEVIKALEQELNKKDAEKKQAQAKPSSPKSETKTQTQPVRKPAQRQVSNTQEQKISKTAVFATLLAIISISGVVGSYLYQEQTFEQKLAKYLVDIDSQQQQLQNAVNAQLSQNQSSLREQLSQTFSKNNSRLSAQLAEMESKLSQSQQSQPSDWSLNEAEFLIRAANRTLLLDKDTTAVKTLLIDADKRIASMNDPQFLPLRAAIRQDMEQLDVLPKLDTDTIILSLMGLNQQVNILPLPQRAEYTSNEEVVDKTLSNDIADWRSNLHKTWLTVQEKFLTVRTVTGSVEPLLDPNQQSNLKQNLSLKLQLAQWAASQQSTEVYAQTLVDIENWVTTYFDMAKQENINFLSRINELKQLNVSVNYPDSLSALKVIRSKIAEASAPAPLPELPKAEENADLGASL